MTRLLSYILICFAFVFTTVMAMVTNSFNYQNKLLNLLKEKELFNYIDNSFKNFMHYKSNSKELDLSIILNSISLINEIMLLLLLLLSIYYIVQFAVKFINMGLINAYKPAVIFKVYFKDKIKYLSSWGVIIKKFIYSIPLFLPFVMSESKILLLILMISFFIFLFVENLNVKTYYIVAISTVVTIAINFLMIYKFNKIYGSISQVDFMQIFVATYVFVSISVIIVWVFYQSIKIEYLVADLEKKYLFLDNIIFNPKNEFNTSSIIINIYKRKRRTRKEVAIERARVIKKRNKVNLIISCFTTLIVFLITPIFLIFFENYYVNFLMMLLVFIFVRFLMRSYEILKSFFKDVIYDKNKSSTLTYMDRIILIVKSLVEISLLAFNLKVIYYYLINGITTSSIELKNIINFLLESFTTQLFNISYSLDDGLFFAIVHAIQIVVSGCLILFCFALYSGKVMKYPKYEVIQDLTGTFKVYEYLVEYRDVKYEFKDLSELNSFYISGQIEKQEYKFIKEAFNHLFEWKIRNDELKQLMLKYFT